MAKSGKPPADSPGTALDDMIAERERLRRSLRRSVAEDAAEDAIQEAFVKVLARGGAEGVENRLGWFRRLARNRAVDEARREGAARRAGEAYARENAAAVPPPSDASPCRCTLGVLDRLRPAYAEIVRRVDLGEEDLADVAHSLGITANAARVRLHRARGALRRSLEKVCGACARGRCQDCGCRSRAGKAPAPRPR